MYLYFDRQGVLREIIGEPVIQGSSNANSIRAYFDDPSITSAYIWLEKPSGDDTYNHTMTRVQGQYVPEGQYKYFNPDLAYDFYEHTLTAEELDENGIYVATIKAYIGADQWATQGLITFKAESAVVSGDRSITQSDKDYMLSIITQGWIDADDRYAKLAGGNTLTGDQTIVGSVYVPNSKNIYFTGDAGIKGYQGAIRFQGHEYLQVGIDNAQKVVYSFPYYGSMYYGRSFTLATQNWVSALIDTVKHSAFKVVDTRDYPTLADFLANFPGEEGNVYLYPIDPNDLTQGYYQYIWEDSSWLSIGSTAIDLSQYYDKAASDARFQTLANISNNLEADKNSTTKYPSVKEAYDAIKEVRDVAEGKTQGFVLSCRKAAPFDEDSYTDTYLDANGNELATYADFSAYASGYTYANGLFDSSNSTITPSGFTYLLLTLDVHNDVFQVILMPDGNSTLFKQGDVVIVSETNVPDRWIQKSTPSAPDSFNALESKADLSNYYTKSEVNSLLAGKLDDKADGMTTNALYAINSLGQNATFSVSTSANAYDVVMRRAYGQITVPETPIADSDAASKKWVDAKTQTYLINPDHIQPTSQSDFDEDPSAEPPVYAPYAYYYNGQRVTSYADYEAIFGHPWTYVNPLLKTQSDLTLGNESFLLVHNGWNAVSGTHQERIDIILCQNADLPYKEGDILRLTSGNYPDRFVKKGDPNVLGADSLLPVKAKSPDISNMMTTDTNQTVTGMKTFSNGIELGTNGINYQSFFYFKRQGANIASIDAQSFSPAAANKTIGNSYDQWKDGYFSGSVYANNTFNVINASDIGSNILSDDQYALITNGKPTLIKGTYQTKTNIMLSNATEITSFYTGICFCQGGTYGQVYQYSINKSTKAFDIATTAAYLLFQGGYVEVDGFKVKDLQTLNGKAFPSYPSNTGTFALKCVDGTLTWVQEP